MPKEKKICPDCGSRMKRTNSNGRVEIQCPKCELGITMEKKDEYRWKKLLLQAKKQWMKERVTRICNEA